MEKITADEVEKIARLANLNLSENEKKTFVSQLNNVLFYMETLNKLDTSGIEPTTNAVPTTNAFREDAAAGSLERELSLKNAPDRDAFSFKVPKVIE